MTAIARFEQALEAARRRHLAPPPKLTVSEWADQHRMVSSYSAEPGPWRTDRTPYLREIMDSFNDPSVNLVVFMKPARIGGTEAGLNIVGYFIDQDPSPILIVQPTVDDAKDFSKEQLAPMLADTPALAAKISDPRSRDAKNTVQAKVFAGGMVALVGANSPRGFRRRTSRILDLEEIDGYPASAGTEGDQIKLAIRRTATFGHRRKVYLNSTPTLKGLSRIEDYFSRSDQRRYHLPCPVCEHRQHLMWKNLHFGDGPPIYSCEQCAAEIPEEEKFAMLLAGEWVPHNPGAPTRGYHINQLYSPWVSWSELVDEWREAQGDPQKLQVFVNTALGETWEERGGGLAPGLIEARKEGYPAEVPNGVAVLTMGVDVQADRLEYVIRGFGAGEESWLIAFDRIIGNTSLTLDKPDSPWAELERRRLAPLTMESGRPVKIFATCIDSGDQADVVYAYCGPRFSQRVYATKGSSEPGKPLVPRRPTRNNKARIPLFLIGTDTGKDLVHGRLKLSEKGPLYMHLPDPVPAEWVDQVTSERKVRKQLTDGKWVSRWMLPIGARNEALDCEVLAIAALRLAPIRTAELGKLAVKQATHLEPAPEAAPGPEEGEASEPPPPAPDRPASRYSRYGARGSWATKW